MQTDDNAFIYSGRKFKSDHKVCFIGGSFVENKFVDQGSRWFSCLEKLLLEKGIRTQVLNAGYSGATSLNVLNAILNKVINNGIDAVYYCVSSNDYSALSYDQTYWNTTKNHSNLLLSEYDEIPKGSLKPDNFTKMIRSIHDVCCNFDIDIHFMTYPNLCGNTALTCINDLLRTTCQDFNYSVIDTDLFMQSYKVDFERLFHDKLHLNEEGSEIFAKILLDNHFLNDLDADANGDLMVVKSYKDLHQDALLIELGEYLQNDHVAYSLIIDVQNQDLKKDKLLIQLESDNLKGTEQEGFEFSEELGWHAFVDVSVRQAQIRYSFVLSANNSCVLKISLESQELLDGIISNLTFETYKNT